MVHVPPLFCFAHATARAALRHAAAFVRAHSNAAEAGAVSSDAADATSEGRGDGGGGGAGARLVLDVHAAEGLQMHWAAGQTPKAVVRLVRAATTTAATAAAQQSEAAAAAADGLAAPSGAPIDAGGARGDDANYGARRATEPAETCAPRDARGGGACCSWAACGLDCVIEVARVVAEGKEITMGMMPIALDRGGERRVGKGGERQQRTTRPEPC